MTEILTTLGSPAWWFTAVIVGILINLVSSYLKQPIDDNLSRISTKWKIKTEKKKREDEIFVEYLSRSEYKLIKLSFDEMRFRIYSVSAIVFWGFVMVGEMTGYFYKWGNVAHMIALIFGALSLFISFASIYVAGNISRIVHLANMKKLESD